jgi:hypothetical protein
VGSYDHVLLHQAIHDTTSQDPDAASAYLLPKAPGWVDRTPEPVPGRGGRQNGQTSGEILPTQVYRKEKRRMLPGLVLFTLVASPLQPGVVGPYSVWGVWFHSCLPLEGTDHIQNFGRICGGILCFFFNTVGSVGHVVLIGA